MALVQQNETYERFVQDPEDKSVHRIVLRPVTWGETTTTGDVKIGQGADGEGEARLSPGETKRYLTECALVRWEGGLEKLGPPTADVLKRLNPIVAEQIWYYVDAGEGKPAQKALVDAAGEPIELKTSSGDTLELEGHRGNGAVPLAEPVGAAPSS